MCHRPQGSPENSARGGCENRNANGYLAHLQGRGDPWERLGNWFSSPDAARSHSHWATGLAKYSVTKETQVVSPEPYGNNDDLFRKSKVCHFKLTATKLLFDYLPPYCIVLSQ